MNSKQAPLRHIGCGDFFLVLFCIYHHTFARASGIMNLVIIGFICHATAVRGNDVGDLTVHVWPFILYKHAFAATLVYPVDAVVTEIPFMQV
jgi:hypothetical protein